MNITEVIISVPRLSSSKNFETKIAHIINKILYNYNNYIASYIIIENAGMKLDSGYNSYNYFIDLKVNSVAMNLLLRSNNSEDYDFFKYPDQINEITYSNRLKNLIVDVILWNKQKIKDKYQLYMENF